MLTTLIIVKVLFLLLLVSGRLGPTDRFDERKKNVFYFQPAEPSCIDPNKNSHDQREKETIETIICFRGLLIVDRLFYFNVMNGRQSAIV